MTLASTNKAPLIAASLALALLASPAFAKGDAARGKQLA